MKVKRMNEMSELERAIMMMIWDDIKELPHYSSWRKYERGFTYDEKNYRYKCNFKIEDGHLRLINAEIEHEQVIIELMH
ncbi:MAG TPA: hypothetical protein VNU45_18100 [Rummeliibacillus sp.]|nr:hypothetical protein [Rummeliibacillus sp.]